MIPLGKRLLKIIKGSWIPLTFKFFCGVFWMLSFIILLFVKDFSLIWKLSYIGFIILLTVITIFRIKESQKEWYKDDDDENFSFTAPNTESDD